MNSRFRLMCVWGVSDPEYWSCLHGGGKGSKAPDPNPGLFRAAEVSEKLGERSLDIYEDEMQWTRDRYAELEPLYRQVIDAQLAQMEQQAKLAEDYDAYNRGVFRPLEQQIVDEAKDYDSVENQERAATRASADVISAYDRNRASFTRSLQGLGVNMSSPAAVAALRDMTIDKAAAQAGAENRARENVKTVGRALRMDAASLGRGLPSAQATSASLATSAGSAATGSAAQQTQGYLAGSQAAQGWFNTGVGAYGQAGNIYAAGHGAQMNAWQANTNQSNANAAGWGSAFGTVLGGIGGFMAGGGPAGALAGASIGQGLSDEDAKTDIRSVDEDEALEAIERIGIGAWRYKPGIEDGGAQEHIGPMAQDVQRVMGDEVAPDGKVIDLISANGVNMLGIKALAKKVKKLERLIEEGVSDDGGDIGASGIGVKNLDKLNRAKRKAREVEVE